MSDGTGNPTGAARDPSSLESIVDAFHAEGFESNLSSLEGGDVHCPSCGKDSAAATFEVAHLRRTEGASDPGDMSAVVAMTCPNCSTRGVLVARYGPEAGLADADVLAALPRADEVNRPSEST